MLKKILLFVIIIFVLYSLIKIQGVLILVGLYFIFFFVHKKKYHIKLVCGQTGSGKTLLSNHFAQKYIKKKKNVYTTFCCLGAKKLPINFYDYKYPKDSLLIIDESQISLDSRELTKNVKQGVSNKLLAMLSMHRHNKLDIIFICQNPEDVDVRIRRYCTDFLIMKKIIYFRRITKKFKSYICPLILKYEYWSDFKDYERYLQNSAQFGARDYGASYRYALTLKRSYTTYSTYQEDISYQMLNDISNKSIFWKDFNELLITR